MHKLCVVWWVVYILLVLGITHEQGTLPHSILTDFYVTISLLKKERKEKKVCVSFSISLRLFNKSACVCVCARARACVCVCVCVCVASDTSQVGLISLNNRNVRKRQVWPLEAGMTVVTWQLQCTFNDHLKLPLAASKMNNADSPSSTVIASNLSRSAAKETAENLTRFCFLLLARWFPRIKTSCIDRLRSSSYSIGPFKPAHRTPRVRGG
jgi:hypothetical protein